MNIRNIIFDLGGVLLNLDFGKTFSAFAALGIPDFAEHFRQSHSNPLFARLETGTCSPAVFYDTFRRETGITADNTAIEAAWNAMLLDFRKDSVAYLDDLKKNYRIFLLSNTNIIHLQAFRNIHLKQFGHQDFDGHFEKAWYSHELGLRKPHVACYEAVLAEKQLVPAETLFVDDTEINIAGAEKAGIRTLHLQPGQVIEHCIPAYVNQ